jgi:hypothetical protein
MKIDSNDRFYDEIGIDIIPEINDTKLNMMQLLVLIDEWQRTYHFDKGVLIFQNKENLTNIQFNNNSLHKISKHTRGVQNLPKTLMHPTEIWSRWGDLKQMIVLRNYILIGQNISYICMTKDGIVTNAFAVTASLLNRYRRGLLMIRAK